MKLIIDGQTVSVRTGQSLRDIVKQLGLATGKLSTEPLAAKIAGEVFTLNYIPLREKEFSPDRPSVRRAMAASKGTVSLLRYSDPTGKDAYARTAQFVLFLALRQLWPQARAKMNCTVGAGLYIEVGGAEDFSVAKLKEQVAKIVADDIPLLRRRITTKEAIALYTAQGQYDKARLLSYREADYFDIYSYGDFADYFYGEMAPSTGYLRVWDILSADGGFIFVYPDDMDPDRVAEYTESPNFFSVFSEGERWGKLMECETVADLNDLVSSGKIRELIRVNEALHEKK